jgi:hypothetical protein
MLLKRTGIADRIGILPACRAVRYSKAILARFCDELVSAPDIIWACFPSKHDNCSVEHERTEKFRTDRSAMESIGNIGLTTRGEL